jgi:hypothetical protein
MRCLPGALDKFLSFDGLSGAPRKVHEAVMRSVKAYNAGYDAYLRRYGQSNNSDKPRSAWVEEPHNPYVDDLALYSAWLEGWQDAGGRFRRPSGIAFSIHTPSHPPRFQLSEPAHHSA